MRKHVWISAAALLALVIGVGACTQQPAPAAAPAKMSNDDLDRAVTAKINSDAALVAYKLGVSADADKNEVTLSGAVPTEGLRMKAIDAAKAAMPGLVVTDKIDVKPGDVERKDYNDDMAREARDRATKSGETVGDSVDDAWIHTKISTKLLTEKDFPDSHINVDVKNNVVTLRGSVPTRGDKTRAEQVVKSVEGVKSVKDLLVIKPAR